MSCEFRSPAPKKESSQTSVNIGDSWRRIMRQTGPGIATLSRHAKMNYDIYFLNFKKKYILAWRMLIDEIFRVVYLEREVHRLL